jgi:hypothetical protein
LGHWDKQGKKEKKSHFDHQMPCIAINFDHRIGKKEKRAEGIMA